MASKGLFPWQVKPEVSKRARKGLPTPLIYYGGKTMMADTIIEHMPPHKVYVEVFGGGAAVLIAKGKSDVEIYNDKGNVAYFFRVLRDYGDDLYRALYLTPYSHKEFLTCRWAWQQQLEKALQTQDRTDWVEFARQWFTTVNQGFTHEELDSSPAFRISKQADAASALKNHVDDLPDIVARLRNVEFEHRDFRKIIQYYDAHNVLFYLDPPYIAESRYENGNYLNEMTKEDHEEMLKLAINLQGQAIISGYETPLYMDYLKDWRVVRETRKSQIHNVMQQNAGAIGTRTEVLWIKEHAHGLWTVQDEASAYVSRIPDQGQASPDAGILVE